MKRKPITPAERARKARQRAIEQAAACIPRTWLDSLLTGDRAVIGPPPWGCPEVERLLNAIRERIKVLV